MTDSQKSTARLTTKAGNFPQFLRCASFGKLLSTLIGPGLSTLGGARKGLLHHRKTKGTQETGRNYESSNFKQRPSGKYVQKSGSNVPVLEKRPSHCLVSFGGRMEHERLAHQAFHSGKSAKQESRVQRPSGTCFYLPERNGPVLGNQYQHIQSQS